MQYLDYAIRPIFDKPLAERGYRKVSDPEVQARLELMEFSIGVGHTISTGPFENIKIEAKLTCGVKRGITNEEFGEVMKLAQAKLKETARETYKAQKRPEKNPAPDQKTAEG